MDALSDVLRVVQLTGAVFLDGAFSAPWCVIGHADSALCSGYLPPAEFEANHKDAATRQLSL